MCEWPRWHDLNLVGAIPTMNEPHTQEATPWHDRAGGQHLARRGGLIGTAGEGRTWRSPSVIPVAARRSAGAGSDVPRRAAQLGVTDGPQRADTGRH